MADEHEAQGADHSDPSDSPAPSPPGLPSAELGAAPRGVKTVDERMPFIYGETYAGQFPHPQHLERFEAVCPGMADRLVTMAEKDAEHRRRVELRHLDLDGQVIALHAEEAKADARFATRGQQFALAYGVAGLAIGGTIVILNPTWTGAVTATVLGGGSIASIVIAFLKTRLRVVVENPATAEEAAADQAAAPAEPPTPETGPPSEATTP